MKVNEIRIGDRMYSRWFLEHDSGQRTLAYAHRERLEVVCLCNNVPMHIAHTKRYFLKRNPGTGSLHATKCASFTQDDIETVAAQPTTTRTSVERENGNVKLTLGFPAPYFAGLHSVEARPNGVLLQELLRILWREAGLNIWRDTRGVFDWGTIREKLDEAAGRFLINGNGGIGRYLLLPKPFSATEVDAHKAEREVWLRKFRLPAPGGVFLVGGFLKSHAPTRNGNTLLQIKHMADEPLIASGGIDSLIESESLDGQCDVFLLARVKCSGQYLIADEVAALSVTHSEKLPVSHAADLALTTYLLAHDRKFIKPISASGKELDGAFLTDCAGGRRIGFKGTAPSGAIEVGENLAGLVLPPIQRHPAQETS